jgi:hypothetical protein
MSSSGRKVYDRLVLQDFQSSRIESIVIQENGASAYIGTIDGLLSSVQLRSTPVSGPDTIPSVYKCISLEPLRKSKEKKPVAALRIVQVRYIKVLLFRI